jgi:hypothetical protein
MTAYNVKSNSAFAGYDLPKADNTLNGARRFFANWAAWDAPIAKRFPNSAR